ncbi:MAG: hypothetical protein QOD06_1378 [Candidatus Binatota bacterium]|nr:hypothetical protein [Candidatus Binatota bacterium]
MAAGLEVADPATHSKALPRARAVHLLVLWGFAVAQPLYDLLGHNAEFFVAHDSSPVDLLAFTALLSLAVPSALIGLERVAGLLSPPLERWMHVAFMVLLAAVFAAPVAARLLDGLTALLASACLGACFALAYARFTPVRTLLLALSPSILLFPALFLFGSPVRRLVWPASAAPATVRVSATAPVVMVVLDELPLVSLLDERREIDSVRFPAFADLARSSHWFRNTTTVSQSTTLAVPAILTGRYPRGGQLPTATEQPENLFSLLGGSYELHAFETATRLCPQPLCSQERSPPWTRRLQLLFSDSTVAFAHRVAPARLAERLPPIDDAWGDFLGAATRPAPARDGAHGLHQAMRADRRQLFAEFVELVQHGGDRQLLFLHILLPHAPWAYLPSGRTYSLMVGPGPGMKNHRWGDDPYLPAHGQQRHLLQVEMVDGLLGDLLEALRSRGLFDRTLIVVTADHGVTFQPGIERRDVGARGDVFWVPLLMKLPGQTKGVISERAAQTIDVLPTIADALEIALPWSVDGHSLFAAADAAPRFFLHGRKLVPLTAGPEALDEALRRKLGRFGARDRERLFRIGDEHPLVGQRVDASDPAPSDVWAELDYPSFFRDVRRESAFIPANVTGKLHGAAAGETRTVAVAVNGITRAVAPTFRRGNQAEFSVVVPEDAFREGDNEVTVFGVEHGTAGWVLSRLDREGEAYELVTANGSARAVRSHSGATFPIRPGAVQGRIGRIRFDGPSMLLTGSVIPREGPSSERVLLFLEDRFLVSAVQEVVTKKSRRSNAPRSRARFQIVLPQERLATTGTLRLHAYALSPAGFASEIPFSAKAIDAWRRRTRARLDVLAEQGDVRAERRRMHSRRSQP